MEFFSISVQEGVHEIVLHKGLTDLDNAIDAAELLANAHEKVTISQTVVTGIVRKHVYAEAIAVWRFGKQIDISGRA